MRPREESAKRLLCNNMSVNISIAPAGVAPAVTLALLVMLFAMSGLISGAALWPDGGRSRKIIVVLVFVALAVFSGWSMLAPYFVQFKVGTDNLSIGGDPWGRTIPLSQLRVTEARRLNWASDSTLRPVRRTGGISMPGYMGGWWRLANGSRGLLFVTDRSRAVLIPAIDGSNLLVTPDDPDQFLDALLRTPARNP